MQTTPSITTSQQAHRPLMRTPRVLLLESDANRAQEVGDQLTAEDMDVLVADSGVMAASRLRGGPADLVIARVELDEGSGYGVVDRLRAEGLLPSHCPVIATSERGAAADRVRALRRGCVDFLALPFDPEEFALRVGLALSRSTRAEVERRDGIEVRGGLRIDLTGRTVTVHGTPVALSKREWELLLLLAADPDAVVTKDQMLDKIWGYAAGSSTRTMDSHACRLRQKLNAKGGDYVHNQWGVGYRLTRQTLPAID